MARQTPLLVKSFPGDFPSPNTPITLNTVLVASGTNAGNVAIPSAAGARGIIGVSQQNFDRLNYGPVILKGVVQCRMLTGTAINFGDPIKVADAFGRVTKAVPVATGGVNIRGLVGTAMQSLPAGTPTDTLVDVLLDFGVIIE
jgi:hypothetical protein